jgi:predicted ATPase/class 3 adenylate cyclase
VQQLPTGTVTFLFTDIEGSTRLLNELGPRADELMASHDAIIRAALTRHGGMEVNTEGDSFFAVFHSPEAAVLAAADAQRALAQAQSSWPKRLRVRMGVHTGEARLAGRDYIGVEVNRAARIAAAAYGGQVLVSQSAAVALADGPPNGLRLRDLGEHRLKDLPIAERLFQLLIDGLEDRFPPPRSLEAVPSGLPQQLTPFFGRRREIAEAQQLLEAARLVTLTGPGGSGKTRLAIELAAEARGAFPDGIVFVPLASLREPDLVLSAVARQFGLNEGADLRQGLIDRIGSRQLLLVLDNFEQLLAAAGTVAELLEATPRLKVLVTSRSRLGIYGERVFAVPPLTVPDPERLPPLARLEGDEEAIALFADRARAVAPAFALTPQNAQAVVEIIRHLDGLPLAIELAAARTRLLGPEAILERLGDRLRLLSSGAHTTNAAERQRTLRGTIQWSYDLLEPDEAALFTRLGVFLGGAPISQVMAVLRADDELALLDQIGSLVDKSLLTRIELDEEVRVEMLETIREFALERLAAEGELEEYRERHALAYTGLAQETAPRVVAAGGGQWLDRLERELPNLRAAWSWAIEQGRGDVALQLATATWRFWQMRGRLVEGRERVEQSLAAARDGDAALQPRALEAAGSLAYWMADFGPARDRYQRWLTLERDAGNSAGVADALYNLAFAYFVQQDAAREVATGRRLAEEALAMYRELGDTAGQAQAVWALGGIVTSSDEPDFEAARRYLAEAARLFAELGNHRMLAWAHFTLAGTQARDGHPREARAALREALRLFVDLGDLSGYALVLRGFATLEWFAGRREAAARLAGASDEIEQRSGVNLSTATSGQWSDEPKREQLEGDPTLAAAWAEGHTLDADAAVAQALEIGED